MENFVGVVLLDSQDRIYLIKEEDKYKIAQDRWNLPGGSVDGNESFIEAASRETKEETGYDVEITNLLGCYNAKKKGSYWAYIVFEAQLLNNETDCVDENVKEGRWFKKDEFLRLDSSQIVHPDMQLVYEVAVNGKGLRTDTVKFIDYDQQ